MKITTLGFFLFLAGASLCVLAALQALPAPVHYTADHLSPATTAALAEAVRRSDETAIADMQPIERLAAAIDHAPSPASPKAIAHLTPQDAAEVAVALLLATDRQWSTKLYHEQVGGPQDLAAWADYWIAVWPSIDQLVQSGVVRREVRANQNPQPSSLHLCTVFPLKDRVVCTVKSERLVTILTFPLDQSPMPELLRRLYPE